MLSKYGNKKGKKMKRVYVYTRISLVALALVGCGENTASTSQTIELPTPKVQSKTRKTLDSDAESIKNSINDIKFAYYLETRENGRWYISNAIESDSAIYSLMPILNGKAGWAMLGNSKPARMDLQSETVDVDLIADNPSCEYWDAGWGEFHTDCLIRSDIQKISNSSNIPILWHFFRASNGNWYIINDNGDIYRFDADAYGQYAWERIDMNGEKPMFYTTNGIKKFKYDSTSSDKVVGIDVSAHNGAINWSDVADSGVKFAFIKVTEGYADYSWSETEALDAKFDYNMKNALANNLFTGAYHFARPEFNTGADEAIKEATYFASKIANYYKNNKLIAPVIDLETGGNQYTKQELTNWVLAFGGAIEEQLGVSPILYLNENYAINEVYLSQIPYKIWIAKYLYNSTSGISINSLGDIESYQSGFEPTINYSFWQYSSTGTDVMGISNYVDKNVFYGSSTQLQSFLVQSSDTDMLPYGTVGGFQDIIAGQLSSLNIKMDAYGKELAKITLHVAKEGLTDLLINQSWNISGNSVHKEYGLNISNFTQGKYYYAFFVKDSLGRFVEYNGSFNITASQTTNLYSSSYRSDNTLWFYGYAPEQFYNYNIGEYSELGSCGSNGIKALGNCTWYAQGRVLELGSNKYLANKFTGNAASWDEIAKNNALTINKTATVGSIAQHNRGNDGHVAIVEKINNDGTITISESSYAPCSANWNFLYRTRDVSVGEFENYIIVPK